MGPPPPQDPNVRRRAPQSRTAGGIARGSVTQRLRAVNKDLEELRYYNEVVKPKLTEAQIEFLATLNATMGIRKACADGVTRDKNQLEELKRELAMAEAILQVAIADPIELTQRIGSVLELP